MWAIVDTNCCTAAKSIRGRGGNDKSVHVEQPLPCNDGLEHRSRKGSHTPKSKPVWSPTLRQIPWSPHYTEVHSTAGNQTEHQQNPSGLGYIVCCCKSLKSSWTPLSSTDGKSIFQVKLHRHWLLRKTHTPSISLLRQFRFGNMEVLKTARGIIDI